ncbi:tRNA (cytidine(34)-2'-O)-methyltransferase [bacterium]|nr:tRNA (cytidine(34)-2'-O)-methyltransferase [bacterium]
MRLAFYQPDIPQNLGAAIRLAACFATPIDIIDPCGFPLTDRALRRSAMDYGDLAVIKRHDGWNAFLQTLDTPAHPPRLRLVLFTTRGDASLQDFSFRKTDVLVFGRESAGVPPDVHAAADARVQIPIAAEARSLNLATAAAIALWEASRQTALLP